MKYAYLLLIMFFSQAVFAGCNPEDLIGYWDYYEEDDNYVVQCSLRVNASGKVSLHRFGCKTVGQITNISTATGQITIDSYCHISGELVLETVTATVIQATLDRNRSTVHGIGESQFGVSKFTLVKFY